MKIETYCPMPVKHMLGDCYTHNERIVLTARERTTLSNAAKLVEQARDTIRERMGERDFDAHPAFLLTADSLLDGEADWMEPDSQVTLPTKADTDAFVRGLLEGVLGKTSNE